MSNVMSFESAQTLHTPLMMSPEHTQRANEYSFARHFIDKYIRFEIEKSTEVQESISQTVEDIFDWLGETYYASKQKRLEPLRAYSTEQMHALVSRMMITCMYCQKPELFTSITASLAHTLKWDTRKASITTIAELLVQLAHNQLIHIVKIESGGVGSQFKKESIAVLATVPLSERLKEYIHNSSYLPPMLCTPKTVKRNSQSGHLTFNRGVTLNGRIQGHLALDAINTQASTALTLDLEFLLNVPERPNKELDTPKKIRAWSDFMIQSNQMYLRIHEQSQGNSETPGAIYFNYFYDLRGRMYAEGYHISPQGSPFKKAMLEFADVQYIEVPTQFQRAA